MSLTFYFAPMSSASPIHWVLAELQLEHEAVELAFSKKEQKAPEFLALNPMGQVPTIVDQGQAMFESSAIVVYLGERYGVERGVWPQVGSPEHMVALAWNTWFAVTVGRSISQVMLNSGKWLPEEQQSKAQAEMGRKRLGELLDILDARLADQPYVVGQSFTLVDAFGAAALGWATHAVGQKLPEHVAAWHQRCMGRAAAGSMK